LPAGDLFPVWWNHGEKQYSDEKEPISTASKDSWVFENANSPQKEESHGRNYLFTSVNMYVDTITEGKLI
jgi:hypothetical protein